MSLLNKATIITTPTAHSNGVLHSIKGGSVADFDVVRGSAATRVNAEGLIEDVATNIPRIDYTDGTASILLEPQSTNLITYSEDLGQAYWADFGAETTRTLDSAVANPTGSLGAYKIEGASGLRRFGIVQAVTPSTDYTLSFYVKNVDATLLKTIITNSSVSSYIFNSEVNSTDWTRVEVNFTSSTGTTCIFQVTRDLPIGESAYFWGLQLEEDTPATSYIPTSGAIATRLADLVTGAGDATTFNSTEGVLYFEGSALENGGVSRYISLSDNTTSNRLQIVYHANANRVSVGGTLVGTTLNDFSFVQTDNNKIAISYSALGIRVFINGALSMSNTVNASFPAGAPTTFDFALWNQSTAPFFGKVKSVITFDTALTDEELECLTTI